jgi:putative glutamine amidotransferase
MSASVTALHARSRRPLIGITSPRIHAAEIATTPPILLHAFMDVAYAHYAQAVARAGGLPVLVPRENEPEALVDRLDGIVVAGGQDVDPRLYDAEPGPGASRIDPARDAFEAALIRAALAARRPLLGICRGAQLLNVVLGGTLVDGLAPSHAGILYPPDARVHDVAFAPGSLLAGVYGPAARVNSFHRQAVGELGAGVVGTCRAADGLVEAIEVPAARAVGVQWHPEMLGEVDPLLAWLVHEAGLEREGERVREGVVS